MTVTRLSLGVDNWLDANDETGRAAATLTASSQATAAPVTKLLEPVVGDTYRTDFATTFWFQADWGVDRDVDVFAFAQPWLAQMMAAADTLQHFLDPAGGIGGTGAAYSSGVIACGVARGYGLHLHLPPATKTGGIWRCAITATSLAAAPRFVDIGRAWVGPLVEFSRNAGFGYVDRPVDPSKISTALRSGAQYVDVIQGARTFSFGLSVLSDSDGRHTVKEIQRTVGVRRQFLFIPNPQGADVATEAMFCRDTANAGLKRDATVTWSTSYQLQQTL